MKKNYFSAPLLASILIFFAIVFSMFFAVTPVFAQESDIGPSKVYPNPVKTTLHISSKLIEGNTLHLWDVIGEAKTVIGHGSSKPDEIDFDVTQLANGYWFFTDVYGNTHRIIITK